MEENEYNLFATALKQISFFMSGVLWGQNHRGYSQRFDRPVHQHPLAWHTSGGDTTYGWGPYGHTMPNNRNDDVSVRFQGQPFRDVILAFT
jgi:hypothetical protein